MQHCRGLKYRDIFAENVIKSLKHKSYIQLFIGPKGSGKKYVLNKIIDALKDEMRIMHFICDSIVEKTKKKNTYSVSLTFDASFYLGVSLSFAKDYNTKLNAILNSLKSLSIKKTSILICIENYDELSSEEKDFINTIVENKDYIEQQLKCKSISCIIINENKLKFNCRYQEIHFEEYSKEDVENYLCDSFENEIKNLDEIKRQEKLSILINCCGGNLALINTIAHEVLTNDVEFDSNLDTIINEIVNQKLLEIQLRGSKEYHLAPGIVEDCLVTCALSIDYFNKILIEYVGEMSAREISNSFRISNEQNKIINKFPNLKYNFVSEYIKEAFAKKLSDSTKFLRYYNYYTENKNDEYFIRAYYLYKVLGVVETNVFNLLILAISKSMMYNDKSIYRIIDQRFDNISDCYRTQIEIFIKAYQKFNDAEYSASISELDKVNVYLLNMVGRAEYNRLYFKSLYTNDGTNCPLTLKYLESLKRVIEIDANLKLSLSEMFSSKNEKILQLRILFDIAPFVLDNLNDVKEFERLYDISRVICRNESIFDSPFAEYIKNVFNRKAFLFANPMQAESYYEEAEAYFYNTSNWTQYIMTLSGKAGILIAQSRYNDAIRTCEQAYRSLSETNIRIPQSYKLDNNYIIAQFLKFEQTTNDEKLIFDQAQIAINELLHLKEVNDKVSFVIMLNIASLYLYQNKINEYITVKKALEKEMKCNDIADIDDLSIDDFYRYRFSWMEIYKCLYLEEYNQCGDILNKLKGFVPSLSHKQDVLWDKKVKAVEELLKNKTKVTSFYFCNCLYDDKRPSAANMKFFYRGLPLSALQFTSFS